MIEQSSESCLQMTLKWVQETYKFNEVFILSYTDDSDEEYFLEVYIQYSKNLHNFNNDLPFLPKRIKIENLEKGEYDKGNICYTK